MLPLLSKNSVILIIPESKGFFFFPSFLNYLNIGKIKSWSQHWPPFSCTHTQPANRTQLLCSGRKIILSFKYKVRYQNECYLEWEITTNHKSHLRKPTFVGIYPQIWTNSEEKTSHYLTVDCLTCLKDFFFLHILQSLLHMLTAVSLSIDIVNWIFFIIIVDHLEKFLLAS